VVSMGAAVWGVRVCMSGVRGEYGGVWGVRVWGVWVGVLLCICF
jgi:hypothetical protein